MQQGCGPNATCLLGCKQRANDSLEHYDYCKTVRTLHEELGGTKAERRIPLWIGTATLHRHSQECNLNDAKSAYATFITTNAARRRGGITADEAGTIFRDAFAQAGDTAAREPRPGTRKREAPTARSAEGNTNRPAKTPRCRPPGARPHPASPG